jgi:hypothetical protein
MLVASPDGRAPMVLAQSRGIMELRRLVRTISRGRRGASACLRHGGATTVVRLRTTGADRPALAVSSLERQHLL